MSDSLARARAADSPLRARAKDALPRPRAAIRRVDQYRPPLGERVGLRLDFNENTRGASPKVLQALRELEPDCLARYPERAPLERRVARSFGLGGDEVLLTNGADEAISLLCQTFLEAGDQALVVVPTFAMYERQAAACGATVVRVTADEDFGFPAARLLSRIDSDTRLIAIADPNNPTGALAGRDDLLAVARAAPQAAILVDEAYGEFSGRTIVPEIRKFPNLFVARTFSKAYGMAGLRVGALLGRADQLAMVRRVASPYSVNAVALACLPAALDDQAYLRSCVAEVRRERELLEQALRARGIRCFASHANFVLARFGSHAPALVAALARRGVLVRDRSAEPGCDGCVRITIGTAAQMRRALAALDDSLAEIGAAQGALGGVVQGAPSPVAPGAADGAAQGAPS